MDNNSVVYHFDVSGESFTSAGHASLETKKILRRIGIDPQTIRRVAIAMYEGEINMVIHANGGVVDIEIFEEKIVIVLKDRGPGIANVELAMQEGFSTAPESIRNLGFGAGMGLPNMKRYSDGMEIETKLGIGTTITLTFNI